MQELIVVPHVTETPTLAITDEGQRAKQELLAKAKPITAIVDAKSRDTAIKIAGNIKSHLKEVEASRVEVKKPFLEVGRLIDSTAGEHQADLSLELFRLNRLVGQFEADRQSKAREDAEALRQEQLRLSAIVLQPDNDLELQGLSDEERGQRLEERLAAEEQLESTEQKVAQAAAAAATQKPTGGALRKDWDIEVLDIKALYAAHPQCVELTPRNLAIKDLLKAGIEPAGVRATAKVDYSARAKTPKLKR